MHKAMALTCIVLLAASAAVADVATVQPVADTFVQTTQPDASLGAKPLYLGDAYYNSDEQMRAYLLFDTSGMASGASVSSVTLNLYHSSNSVVDPDLTVSVYEAAIGVPWDDDGDDQDGAYTPTWNSQPTGDAYRTGDPLDSMDFGSGTSTGEYYSFNVTDAWRRASYLDFVLDTPENTGQWDSEYVGFFSREAPESWRPYLEVTYSDDVAVPAPPAVVLVPLALGAAAFVRRRREDG